MTDRDKTPPPQVWPTLRARDAHALIRFLVDVVGFEETVVYGDAEVVHHAQLSWPLGGGIIQSGKFLRYGALPQLQYRKIFADTAQKTAERNDYSVFQCWGLGYDKRLYLIDQIRGKWKAPELKQRAIDFWNKHNAEGAGDPNEPVLRQMKVEDKSSGTGLIQDIQASGGIPIEGIERVKDKLTRVMDVVSQIHVGNVAVPAEAPWVNDFITECDSFTADDTHMHDDQIDPMVDAINDMLGTARDLSVWERFGSS